MKNRRHTDFSVRCTKNSSAEITNTSENQERQLTPQLTPKSQKQAKIDTSELPRGLAEIIDAWPELPEHIKAAIKALVQTYIEGKKTNGKERGYKLNSPDQT